MPPQPLRRRARGERLDDLAQDGESVAKPHPALRSPDRGPCDLETALFEREQACGEVATVDRRDVARLERRQRARVVPVEEVSAVALEPLQGIEAAPEARGKLACADVAEVPGRERGEEHHADVGGRGPMGDLDVGLLLEVVGRQPLVLWPREALEVEPGPARHAAQERAVVLGELRDRAPTGAAERVGDLGRRDPEGEQRRGGGQGFRPEHPDCQPEAQRRGGCHSHLPPRDRPRASRFELSRRPRRRRPLEQAPARDDEAHERADDRVEGHAGLVGEEDDQQQPAARVVAEAPHDAAHRAAPAAPAEAGHEVGEQMARRRHHAQRRPHPRDPRQHEPAGRQQDYERGSDEAASQVVGDLPAVDRRQAIGQPLPVATGHTSPEPREQLPVPADPAVQPPGVLEVVRGERLVEHHVGREGRASVDALEEVVARERVLGHASLEAPVQGLNVVDALADVVALAEQVLVHVGDGPAVDVDGSIAGEPAGEVRAVSTLRIDLDARLHDRVAGPDAARALVESGVVQRVGERAGEASEAAARERRVGVERDDEAHALQSLGGTGVHGEARIARARHVVAELLELAALALPAHPTTFRRVEAARAMERVERTGRPPAMPLVETRHAVAQRLHDGFVPRHVLLGRIGEVGEEDELGVRLGIRQMVGLEPLEQLPSLVGAADERRYDDRSLAVGGNPLLEVELGEDARGKQLRQQPVHHGDSEDGGRKEDDGHAEREHRGRRAYPREVARGQQHRDERHGHEDKRIAGGCPAQEPASQAQAQLSAVAQAALELLATLVDEPEAHVRPAELRPGGALREGNDALGHLELRVRRAKGQLLDDAAIAICGLEVDARVDAGRVVAEESLHATRRAEEVLPGDRREGAQVAERPSDALRVLQRERAFPRLHPERRLDRGEDPLERGDQHLETRQAEHRWERPEFGDRERRVPLVGLDEAHERRQGELEPGHLQQRAANGDHTRRSRSAGLRERRHPPVERRRKVLGDLGQRAVDQVLVVEPPLGRLRGRPFGPGQSAPYPIGPGAQPSQTRPRRDRLGGTVGERVGTGELAGGDLERSLPGLAGGCGHKPACSGRRTPLRVAGLSTRCIPRLPSSRRTSRGVAE